MITTNRLSRPIPSGIQPSSHIIEPISHILSSENRIIVFDDTSTLSTCSYGSYLSADDDYRSVALNDTGIQNSNSNIVTSHAATETRDTVGAGWYMIAILLWLFSTQGDGLCNYSIIAASVRRLLTGIANEYLRHMLAACLDVLVVTYGAGFLLLYFYQCWLGVQ